MSTEVTSLATIISGIRSKDANRKSRFISYISNIMTLYPGDLIATGTPDGVGPLELGDEVVVVVSGVGELRNSVVGDDL